MQLHNKAKRSYRFCFSPLLYVYFEMGFTNVQYAYIVILSVLLHSHSDPELDYPDCKPAV